VQLARGNQSENLMNQCLIYCNSGEGTKVWIDDSITGVICIE
jgi:hypothetical protein